MKDSSETAAEIEALYRARSSAFLYSAVNAPGSHVTIVAWNLPAFVGVQVS
jgi:hypothetical protein